LTDLVSLVVLCTALLRQSVSSHVKKNWVLRENIKCTHSRQFLSQDYIVDLAEEGCISAPNQTTYYAMKCIEEIIYTIGGGLAFFVHSVITIIVALCLG
jgi:hypothetical protein